MIWLSWRQARSSARIAAVVIALAALMWLVTGLLLRRSGSVLDSFQLVRLINTGAIAVPAVVGAFWGAPLVARELESGTFRLAWTQSVTRTRWLRGKMIAAGLIGLSFASLVTVGIDWWSAPVDAAGGNRFTAALFSVRGFVPVSYTVFAFALGVACGVILRSVVPAMAVTLTVFTAVRIVVTLWIRPHFATPVTTVGLPSVVGPDGAPAVDGSSVTVTGGWVLSDRLTGAGSSVREVVVSQPADRFWSFQWIETALFLGLGAAFVALSFYWVRSRIR